MGNHFLRAIAEWSIDQFMQLPRTLASPRDNHSHTAIAVPASFHYVRQTRLSCDCSKDNLELVPIEVLPVGRSALLCHEQAP